MFTKDDNLKAVYSSDLDAFLEKLREKKLLRE